MEALPLRTGRTNCVTSMQRDMAEQTLAIIASMMQQAAHDATLYCAEAKRTVIMPRDIELALKRLVLPGSTYWTRDDLPQEISAANSTASVRRCKQRGVRQRRQLGHRDRKSCVVRDGWQRSRVDVFLADREARLTFD